MSRHARSNAIDAETLARLPLVDPKGLAPLELPGGARASLDRRGRTCQWLTEQATAYKIRIRDLARQLFPTLNDGRTSELRIGDLAVLEHSGDPRALLEAGPGRIAEVLFAGSAGRFPPATAQARARAWVGVAQAAVALCKRAASWMSRGSFAHPQVSRMPSSALQLGTSSQVARRARRSAASGRSPPRSPMAASTSSPPARSPRTLRLPLRRR